MHSSPDPPLTKEFKGSDWHSASSSRGVGFLLDSPNLMSTNTGESGSSSGSNFTGETSRDNKHSRNSSRLSGAGSNDASDSPKPKQIKDAARLGSLFMNIKYAALNDIGEVSPSANQHERKTHNPHISAGTHARALKAKAYLELEYQMMRDFQQPIKVQMKESNHEGNEVELSSCYNPLQVLRNRLLRPTPHIHDSDVKDQNGWGIDPFELVADYGWRDHHLALLRRGDGRMVYPQLKGAKLSPVESGITRHLGSRISPSKQDELLNRIKQKFQKLSPTDTGSSISYSEPEDHGTHGEKKHANSLRTIPSDHDESTKIPMPHKRALSTPHIILDQPEVGESDTEDASRPSLATATRSTENTSDSQTSSSPSPTSPVSDDSRYLHNLRYLQTLFFLSANTYFHMLGRLDGSMNCEKKSKKVTRDIDALVGQINETLAQQSKQFISARSPLVDSLRQLLLKEKTYAVDSILLDSDRVLTEASTTLNLEVRKLGERIGRLERKETARKFLRELAYSLLAWVVTVIMWMLWVIVTILLITKKTVILPFKIMKWLVWS